MNSKVIRGCIELIRPVNVLIIMVVIGVAALLASGEPHMTWEVVLAMLVGGLVGGAANVINDYFDVEIDRINKPGRPLPRGAVSRKAAYVEWFALSLVGLLLNLFLPLLALWIALTAVITLYLYSARLKRTSLWGNAAVALMTALALIYGAVVTGHPGQAVMPALFAFLINFGREIIKDIEDIEGDRRERATTFPIRHGTKKALFLVTAILVALVLSTIWAYVNGLYNMLYLALVAVVDVVVLSVIVVIWRNQTPTVLGRTSTALKWSMLVGLCALYFGS